MILQALHDYYQRRMADPDASRRLPDFGWEEKEIPFIVELSKDGRPLGITDTRQGEEKKKTARRYRVPQGVKKTSGVAANLLWDAAEYALGVDTRGNPKRVEEQHAAFRQRIAALPEGARQTAGIQALEGFYARHGWKALEADPSWTDIRESNPNVSFRLYGEGDLICQNPAIAAVNFSGDDAEKQALCLITGEQAPIERLHTAIKGVWGAQSSGANIVSFNLDAFASFNKEQGDNAPVSRAAAFAYTTALNHLLAKNSRQRIQVGDASTVFWAQKDDALAEDGFAATFNRQDDPDAETAKVRALLDAVHAGVFAPDSAKGQNRFHVLGLSPNAARIAVRFWHAAPIHEIAARIRQWFVDLKIVRGPNDPEFPSLFRLLVDCAVLRKADNIPPNLGGDTVRAILNGGPLPASLLNAAVLRCRAEQRVVHSRAAIIKACLIRSRINHPTSDKESFFMLDIANDNPAYRLGRLFATLEKIQEEANPGLNATIRERYYGAASSTPTSVFTTLLRLKNHHLAKLSNRGRAVNFERLLGEIMEGLDDFPKHLNLQDQGRFALGYYHQRQEFYKPKSSDQSKEGEAQ
ncbi:MAG: type I-C CRISPR-associated protein Cas8c/Csd1 [Candidatus Accumulibacter sp.]|jgi:CRISPR-associated protein Csd1|nr:type I-C CRISPR-associated protein Cas8c/Csd1 [Accumulibacter sp.]